MGRRMGMVLKMNLAAATTASPSYSLALGAPGLAARIRRHHSQLHPIALSGGVVQAVLDLFIDILRSANKRLLKNRGLG